VKVVDPTVALVQGVPLTVYAGFTCSSVGLDEAERRVHADSRLAFRASQAVEGELWSGAVAQANGWPTPFLASPAATQLTTGAESSPLRHALGSLQDALRSCMGDEVAGVIHATPMTVSLWRAEYLVDVDDDGVIRDVFGNVIVGGAGYDGSAPDGSIDPSGQTVWAYASGPVRVMLGPVYMVPDTTGEALARSVNDITWRAERSATAMFDPCCLFGISVNLCSECCAAPGGGGE
jgi:hypothetical protein